MVEIRAVYYESKDETVNFAAAELVRLLKKAGHEPESIHSGFPAEPGRAVLLETDGKGAGEGFTIKPEGEAVRIRAENARSLLYGVYRYCEKTLGFRWPQAGTEKIIGKPEALPPEGVAETPLLSRRGNIFETISEPDYINGLIDWGAKHGMNEYFFTFFLWDEVKGKVEETLRERGMKVTLGGHSLRYLVKEAAGDDVATASAKFFSGNEELQDKVIERIVRQCRDEPVIRRISLWPEDIGVSEREFSDFLPRYILFMERLQAKLDEAGLPVRVEHIVYNAGLAWNMLERGGTRASAKTDILYAYWGRDYSKGMAGGGKAARRALVSLRDWTREAEKQGTSLTVLEYYSDHFMLSELFPPLFSRIFADMDELREAGAAGVLNLIVPLHVRDRDSELAREYPWRRIHQLNNFFYAGACWGRSREEMFREFSAAYGEGWLELFLAMENAVSRHTGWNTVLFPARVADPEKADNEDAGERISALLGEIAGFIEKADVPETGEQWLFDYLCYVKETAQQLRRSWEKKGAVH